MINIVLVTERVFPASGVDAVGEVVMNVDILPQPNGEHKISVKGKSTVQTGSWYLLLYPPTSFFAHFTCFLGGFFLL